MKPQERINVIRASRLEPSMRLLLIMLASYMSDDQDVAWPSVERLAGDTGLSTSTVHEILRKARHDGLIERWSGEHKAQDTRIVWSAVAAWTPSTPPSKGPATVSTPPVIGPHPPDTGEVSGLPEQVSPSGNRRAPLRPSDPTPPVIGGDPSGNRTRSDQDPTNDPTKEPTNALAREGPSRPEEPRPRPTPPTPEAPHDPPAQPTLRGDAGTPPALAGPTPEALLDLDRHGAAAVETGGGGVAGGADDPKRRRKAAEVDVSVLAVWGAWQQFHPRASMVPPRPDEAKIRAALKHQPAEVLVAIVEWAHLAPHKRAAYLRGENYAPGKTGDYLGIQNLMVADRLTERAGHAAEWQEAGRPDYRDVPATVARGPVDARAERERESLRDLLGRWQDAELEVINA